MKMFMATLEQQKPTGIQVLMGWIEERAAKIGAFVEVKGEDGLWLVTKKGDKSLESFELLKRQTQDRSCLPSIKVR